VKAPKLVALLALCGVSLGALAQYPNKPIHIVNPFAAGGSGDIVTRIATQKISENTGKVFVLEAKTGAAGRIGYEAGTRAAPDGYNLTLTDTTYTMMPALHGNLPWYTPDSLLPVTIVAQSPFLIVVRADLKVTTLREFLALAKANPGKLNYGSAGIGSINHVTTELFKREAGVDLVHVPYKGMSDAITGLVSGSLDMIMLGILPISPQIAAGKAIPLAIAAPQRSPGLPNVPTVDEAGLPGYRAGNWFGWTAPAGTPVEALDWLQREVARAMTAPEVRERLLAQGVVPSGMPRDEFGKIIRDDAQRWALVIRSAGIKAE
jgi:tripartite-type tricarboxylate transporter receptor subunit TctC